jgi:hypothetical protein
MGFSSPVSITYIRAAEIPERPRRSALAKVGRSFGRRCGSTRRPSNLFTSEHGSLQSRNCWNNTTSFSCESRGYTIYRCRCPDVQPPHALGRHCKPGLSLHHCREPLGTITARGMDLSLLETPQDFASLHRTCNKVGPHVGAPSRDRHSPILVLLMSSSADGSLDACKPAYESSMGINLPISSLLQIGPEADSTIRIQLSTRTAKPARERVSQDLGKHKDQGHCGLDKRARHTPNPCPSGGCELQNTQTQTTRNFSARAAAVSNSVLTCWNWCRFRQEPRSFSFGGTA